MGCVGNKEPSGKTQGPIKAKLNDHDDFDLNIYSASLQKDTSKPPRPTNYLEYQGEVKMPKSLQNQ